MAPLEPWKRVFIDPSFLESLHGQIECTYCHLGDETARVKDGSHVGLIAHPSEEEPDYFCAPCHENMVETHKNSLHWTIEGYYERFELRAGYDIRESGDPHALEEYQKECGACHAGCGQCHVMRPISVGSGMDWGHEFRKTPDQTKNCTACHGSRIGDEYTGAHTGYQADVHYIPGAKKCEYCHSGDEMHGGDGTQLTYRYDEDNTAAPRCENCHADTKESNTYHTEHWAGNAGVTLSCHVCHSQPYTNCNGCHVGGEGITGLPYLTFEIGRNYLKSNSRYKDYDYITVRHIPISPETYTDFGVTELDNFENSEPTWKMAAPHNIRRWTPQTETEEGKGCGSSCHNSDYYLRSDDIDTYKYANKDNDTGEFGYGYDDISRERRANKDVIIP